MDRDSNLYTFLFATIMVFVIAIVLAYTSQSLKGLQKENIRKEKMQNILSTVGVITNREGAEELYDKYIEEQIAVQNDGSIDPAIDVFNDIKLVLELRKSPENQNFPLYVANIDSERFYIIPIRGNGLWNAIWGYISLKEDLNTVKGVVFDHAQETAGLGAEITQDWFKERFINEKLFDSDNNLIGITVSKTNNDPNNEDKEDFEVDAMSGATITGDGVSDMIKERLEHYVPYLNTLRSNKIALN